MTHSTMLGRDTHRMALDTLNAACTEIERVASTITATAVYTLQQAATYELPSSASASRIRRFELATRLIQEQYLALDALKH